eukprot:Phypoly_transcript_03315.p1 GENE.Phypoly_transcript_03315~~Phypoly_transcript_03315.p1  ORF type:complete len:430 (-),score=36.99 Phypoly_transcript_03315:82-1371(-)
MATAAVVHVSLLDRLRELLFNSNNKVFTAGIGLFLLTQSASLLRSTFGGIFAYIRGKFVLTLDVQSTDSCYEWLLEWLSEQPHLQNTRRLGVESSYVAARENTMHITLVPSLGSHYFKYRNHYVWVNRTRETTFDMASGKMFESVTLTVWARANARMLVQDMMDEAVKKGAAKDEGKTVIFTTSFGDWRRFGARTKRPWKSVVLPAGVKEDLLEDAKTFIENAQWYINLGIPYRRGYLLYGIPGSGKSSLIYAIAGVLNLNISVLSLAQRDLTDDQLVSLLNSAPPNAILVLEDVDAAFVKRSKQDDASNGVSFSGLLNAIDGVVAQEGRLLFMTTNKIEDLDEALIRDGRIDKQIHLGYATTEQIAGLFAHFYSLDICSTIVKDFTEQLTSYGVSMANLQGHFMKYRNSPGDAMHYIQNLKHTPLISQ